ncbi:IS1/IS1595 family N-terminal zinc-binding domain-containing protein [Lachnospira sp.]
MHVLSYTNKCTYCGSQNIIRYGHKYNKQRFLRKYCDRTFLKLTRFF